MNVPSHVRSFFQPGINAAKLAKRVEPMIADWYEEGGIESVRCGIIDTMQDLGINLLLTPQERTEAVDAVLAAFVFESWAHN